MMRESCRNMSLKKLYRELKVFVNNDNTLRIFTHVSPVTSTWTNQTITNIYVHDNFKLARNSFQHLFFDGSLQPLFITWCNNHGIKKLLKHWWTRYHFCDTIGYHSNSITC